MQPVNAGYLVAGRYRLVSTIGVGGSGTVWLANDSLLRRNVAVKEIRLSAMSTDEQYAAAAERAVAEARHAARLDHPRIVSVYDVVTDLNRPWIVMQLVDGLSLDSVVATNGPLPREQVVQLGLWLLEAINAAHSEGLVHRDVKPSNVLIPTAGGAMLTDFSIARAIGSGNVTTGMELGTPGYIAPERIITGQVGPPGDLFGLGATLYYAVEGIPPFGGGDALVGAFAAAIRPHQRPRRAGKSLSMLLDRLLEKDPSRRATISEARELLAAAADPATLDLAELTLDSQKESVVPSDDVGVDTATLEPATEAPATGPSAMFPDASRTAVQGAFVILIVLVRVVGFGWCSDEARPLVDEQIDQDTCSSPEASLLTYLASIPLSSRTLCWLSDQIRTHRQAIRSRWRKLDPAGQALLVLAHLRNGDTHARLAAGYQLGVSTVWRYITETIDLIAERMPTLDRMMGELARLVWVILDGAQIPIDRVADQKPYYNGHKHRHTVNAQFLSDAKGRLRWVSAALPGAVHDITAARHHHIPELLTQHAVAALADKTSDGRSCQAAMVWIGLGKARVSL